VKIAYTVNKENREQNIIEMGLFTTYPVALIVNFEEVIGKNLLEGYQKRQMGERFIKIGKLYVLKITI
jgi:hypothetical protein